MSGFYLTEQSRRIDLFEFRRWTDVHARGWYLVLFGYVFGHRTENCDYLLNEVLK